MHILPVFLVHVLMILISIHGTLCTYYMSLRATYQNIWPEMTFLVQKVKSYILGIENIYIVLIYV